MNDNLQTNQGQIDLLEVFKKLFNHKASIFKIVFVFMIVGVIISFLVPKKYTASSTFVPMLSSESKASGLSGLASLAGISIDGSMGSNDIAPTLYPEIIASVPFKRSLAEVKIPYEKKLVTLKEYSLLREPDLIGTLKKYTIGLPGLVLKYLMPEDSIKINSGVNTNQLIIVSKSDFELYKNFDELISINVDLKEGFIELNVTFDDPVRTAIIAQKAQEILQLKVIELKVKHAKEVLQYTEEQFVQKKRSLYAAQDRLNNFKDNAIFYNTTNYQTQVTRLESEYTNANLVFLEIAKQVEQAKLQVSKDTPIFSVLKPVVVPNEKSSPKKFLIIIIWSFLGFSISVANILFKDSLFSFINKIKK